jgi:hypothetical protein
MSRPDQLKLMLAGECIHAYKHVCSIDLAHKWLNTLSYATHPMFVKAGQQGQPQREVKEKGTVCGASSYTRICRIMLLPHAVPCKATPLQHVFRVHPKHVVAGRKMSET